MTMIKVPFDQPGAMPKRSDSKAKISEILDGAYDSMEWFKYLSDNANQVIFLDCTYSDAKWMTTYLFGFILPAKKETFYRMKYGDGK
jgi:hypothetical protein